jgi:hypothetical protein
MSTRIIQNIWMYINSVRVRSFCALAQGPSVGPQDASRPYNT